MDFGCLEAFHFKQDCCLSGMLRACLYEVSIAFLFLAALSLPKPSSSFNPAATIRNSHRSDSIIMKAIGNINSEIKDKQIQPNEASGFIFDIDGTLADSWKLGFDATQVVLKNRNIPLITEELYHECTRYCTPDRMARHAGLLPDNEDFSMVGQQLADEFDDLYVGLVSMETAGFYEGILDLLLSLQSSSGDKDGEIKLAALTNACVAYAHAVLKINCPKLKNEDNTSDKGIYKSFSSIHGADTVAKPKPFPDGLFQCCEEISIPAEQCVYIGDSPSDAVAAKAAGMLAVGVLWGSHSLESLKNAPFDYMCESVDDLRDLLVRK